VCQREKSGENVNRELKLVQRERGEEREDKERKDRDKRETERLER
jgi:hypothetical protein